jgi:hypothetical protein
MPRTNKTIAERFAEKVQIAPNGCHEWIGALGGSFGYGIINVNGRHTRAHRYAWEQAYGPLAQAIASCTTAITRDASGSTTCS